jgi:transitional endoplasmic reticulum ATPase
LRAAFTRAKFANLEKPVIVFLDEIDVLCPRRDLSERGVNTVVSQLLTLMDGAETFYTANHPFLMIAATNLPDKVDPSLRRPGRFDREFRFRVPSVAQKAALFRKQTRAMPIDPSVDFDALAKASKGYVSADVVRLCHSAAYIATQAHLKNQKARLATTTGGLGKEIGLEAGTVTVAHFREAMQTLGVGSLLRGDDNLLSSEQVARVGGGGESKQAAQRVSGMDGITTRLMHIMNTEDNVFARLGASRPHGVLLYGPPGCGKTRLVASLADAANVSFFSFSGADVYSSYLGESERIVRELFHKAQNNLPAILFFDELDALVCDRGDGGDDSSSGGMELRVLATLLNEMDGVSEQEGLLVVAASNRPAAIDKALLRPGRFDYLFFVPLPGDEAVETMLRGFLKTVPLADDVDLGALAQELCEVGAEGVRYSGAEVQAICKEASMFALSDQYEQLMSQARAASGEEEEGMASTEHGSAWQVHDKHFRKAMGAILPQTHAQDLEELREFAEKHSSRV